VAKNLNSAPAAVVFWKLPLHGCEILISRICIASEFRIQLSFSITPAAKLKPAIRFSSSGSIISIRRKKASL